LDICDKGCLLHLLPKYLHTSPSLLLLPINEKKRKEKEIKKLKKNVSIYIYIYIYILALPTNYMLKNLIGLYKYFHPCLLCDHAIIFVMSKTNRLILLTLGVHTTETRVHTIGGRLVKAA
jgi:hypothetical protein